jgi:predicted  nucleic acid-binding Zn-ribbon protein
MDSQALREYAFSLMRRIEGQSRELDAHQIIIERHESALIEHQRTIENREQELLEQQTKIKQHEKELASVSVKLNSINQLSSSLTQQTSF